MPRTGWIVVCPDGKRRHYPHLNLGDAEHDARAFGRKGCDDALGREGPCPQGIHTVEACTYEPPAPPGEA